MPKKKLGGGKLSANASLPKKKPGPKKKLGR
jgi:hypothetical protein